jgi:hypothetical protein
VPVAGDPDRGGAGPLTVARQRHRDDAGREDAEQPEEDQVVGGVGERPRVAPVVDVQRDVPVHAEQRDAERGAGDARGQRRPSGQLRELGGPVADGAEQRDAAGSMAGEQPEQEDGGDGRAGGGDDDLVERGAARGLGGGGGRGGGKCVQNHDIE